VVLHCILLCFVECWKWVSGGVYFPGSMRRWYVELGIQCRCIHESKTELHKNYLFGG
jgi:hypothetical protein